MQRKILIRYGEIFLKGKNRGYFIKLLENNIKRALTDVKCVLKIIQGRFLIENYSEQDEIVIIEHLKKVAGIFSLSVCLADTTSLENIYAMSKIGLKNSGTFRVTTRRADKTFAMQSNEVSMRVGGEVLDAFNNISVDLHNPDVTINIEIREDGQSYVYSNIIMCLGGMPVGCAGKGLLMLSGGIDSPVAGFMMQKRGLSLDAIHFHSFPYTSEMAKNKVIELAKIVSRYGVSMNLHIVPFTNIQTAIHEKCDSQYMVTLMRRFMIRIAERVARNVDAGAVVTGESLGQVASQTIQGITCTDDAVNMPVFRPLIGMDKEEITVIARKIGTFDTSILPYEDCCTVFLPENPIIKPKLDDVKRQETKIDIDLLVNEAVDNLEIVKI